MIWQPNAAKDFSCNLILTIFLEMIPRCLPLFFQEVSQRRDPPKYILAAEGCTRFVVKFNINYQPKAAQDLMWNSIILGSQKLTRICCVI